MTVTRASQLRVSVVILSCNRYTELARALVSCVRQDYQPREILVIANASERSLLTRISREFPNITILSLEKNIGVAARNVGIKAATGDLIVTIDDDIYFDDAGALGHIVEAFGRHSLAGCITFRVYSTAGGDLSRRDWCHPRDAQEAENLEFETSFLNEGVCAFRRAIFDTIDAYWNALFINMEGADLTWRMFDKGWELWYVPAVKVWHSHSPIKRPTWRAFYYNPKNLILIAYRDIAFTHICQFLVPRLLFLAGGAIVRGQVLHFVRGIVSGVTDAFRMRGCRQPVSSKALGQWHQLRRTMPSLRTRVFRCWCLAGQPCPSVKREK